MTNHEKPMQNTAKPWKNRKETLKNQPSRLRNARLLTPEDVILRAGHGQHRLAGGHHLQQVALDGLRGGRQPAGHGIGAPGAAARLLRVHGIPLAVSHS